MRAAGAAAAAGVRADGLAHRLVLRLEGRPAAARGLDVRVVDREARAHERVHVVDLRARQVRGAERVDDDADAVHLDLVVAVLRAAVEPEGVLEARAAAALDRDPEDLDVLLGVLGEELPDLRRGGLGDRHHRDGFYRTSRAATRTSL